MTIFAGRSYKEFMKRWLKAQPNGGRGLLTRMAKHARMSPAMISHVLSGGQHFSREAAFELAGFMGLNEEESDYFLLLLDFERAGTPTLRARLQGKIVAEQKRAHELGKKLKPDRELDESTKTIFYSHWVYSGVRNMVACPDFKTVESIAQHLHLPVTVTQQVIDFLLQTGLCVMKKGQLQVGPQITHIDNRTPLVSRHHQNWRLQGMSKMLQPGERNMFFTSPMSLSHETAESIRYKLPEFIAEIRALVGPSESETVRCLNIDWFEY